MRAANFTREQNSIRVFLSEQCFLFIPPNYAVAVIQDTS
jgi:hypothetical protein